MISQLYNVFVESGSITDAKMRADYYDRGSSPGGSLNQVGSLYKGAVYQLNDQNVFDSGFPQDCKRKVKVASVECKPPLWNFAFRLLNRKVKKGMSYNLFSIDLESKEVIGDTVYFKGWKGAIMTKWAIIVVSLVLIAMIMFMMEIAGSSINAGGQILLPTIVFLAAVTATECFVELLLHGSSGLMLSKYLRENYDLGTMNIVVKIPVSSGLNIIDKKDCNPRVIQEITI